VGLTAIPATQGRPGAGRIAPWATRPASYVPTLVSDGVRSAAGRSPSKTAVIEGERVLPYRSLVERMDRFASGLSADLGLGPGDHAAILSPNCIEYLEAVLGCSEAGVTAVHLSAKATPAEVGALCAHAMVRTVFVHGSLVEIARAAELPADCRVVVLGGDAYEAWLASGQARRTVRQVEEWETFCIFYTSGTTGAPKGVLVPHRSRVGNFYGMASEYGAYGPTDQTLAVAPLCHGAGLAFAIAPLFFGGSTRLHRRFDPELLLRDLVEHPITSVFTVPTHFHGIFGLGSASPCGRPAALKAIISNSAPLDHRTKERIVERFGDDVLWECYGSTEASIVCNIRPEDQLRKPGSVGQPFVCTEVRLLDDAGDEVPDGTEGELFSRSPFLFNGYWGIPLDETPGWRDGWFSAGDRAVRDDEGYLSVLGRKDDCIISGGINVYPREVEGVLATFPGLREAAVYGVPDERWGQAVMAAVHLQEGSPTSEEDVIAHCRNLLSAYKVPKRVEFVDELPRNANGKIMRRELQARAAAAGPVAS
jgi:long-chain acyl-CoA synthetase